MAAPRSTVRGLAYKHRTNGYECTRCGIRINATPRYSDGWKHVCIPWMGEDLIASGYNPNASTYEQLESLSLAFAKLAADFAKLDAQCEEIRDENAARASRSGGE